MPKYFIFLIIAYNQEESSYSLLDIERWFSFKSFFKNLLITLSRALMNQLFTWYTVNFDSLAISCFFTWVG